MIYSWSEMTRKGSETYEQERTYTRTYEAQSDSEFDGELEVYAHPLCPIPGKSFMASDPQAICTKRTATLRKKTRWVWDVDAEFGTIRPTTYVPDENPLLNPAEVTSDTEISMEDGYIDQDGLLTLNTAGDLVQIKIPVPRVTFTITKNVSIVNGWLQDIAGIVNSEPVRLKGVLYPRGTLMFWNCKLGKDEIKNGIPFFAAQVTIKHKKEGWNTSYLNMGFNELQKHPKNTGPQSKLEGKDGKPIMVLRRALDGPDGLTGDPVTSPVFLDENGQRPRREEDDNGKKVMVIKSPLDVSDIIVINRRFVRYFDFNKLPIK